jgi:hypothetical protein
MARIKVDAADLFEGTCPAVCVRCGAVATCTRAVTVSHEEGNPAAGCALGLLLGPITELVASKTTITTAAVRLPVCPRHAGKGGLYTEAGQGRILLMMAVAVFALLFGGLLANEFAPGLPVVEFAFPAFIAILLAGLIAMSRHSRRMIGAVEMTDRYVVLVNVSSAFARAVVAQQEADQRARESRLRNPGGPPAG